jgi:hypothetical protein
MYMGLDYHLLTSPCTSEKDKTKAKKKMKMKAKKAVKGMTGHMFKGTYDNL